MNKIKTIDFLMAAIIFMAAIIEPLSYVLVYIDVPDYLVKWYPLLNTIVLLLFSLYFVLRLFRYKVCIYTRIISVAYFLVQLFNLTALLVQFGFITYSFLFYPFVVICFLGILQVLFSRLLFFKNDK